MKKMLFIAVIALVSLASCKKEGPQGAPGVKGEQGEQGPGAKTYSFNLTFNPNETYKEYTGIVNDFDAGDLVVLYGLNDVYGNEPYYSQLPVIKPPMHIWSEVSGTTGNVYINITKLDGSAGGVFSSASTISFKAVLIKSTGLIMHPNVDLSNYKEVVKTFNLTE